MYKFLMSLTVRIKKNLLFVLSCDFFHLPYCAALGVLNCSFLALLHHLSLQGPC